VLASRGDIPLSMQSFAAAASRPRAAIAEMLAGARSTPHSLKNSSQLAIPCLGDLLLTFGHFGIRLICSLLQSLHLAL
jgi:hypothetical protein